MIIAAELAKPLSFLATSPQPALDKAGQSTGLFLLIQLIIK
jgi:hypothetical protein